MRKKRVGVNDKGYRVGGDHHRAKLTDEQVDWIRELYEEGMVGYRTLVRATYWLWNVEVSREAIAHICRYEKRASYAVQTKTVYLTD